MGRTSMAPVSRRQLTQALVSSLIALTAMTGCYQPTVNVRPSLIAEAQSGLNVRKAEAARALSPNNEEPLRLSLVKAIEIAIRADAEIKIDRAALAMAQARILSATQVDNPQVRYSQEKLESGFSDEPRVDVEFRVKPPHLGELSARQAIAETDTRVAMARLKMTQSQVESKVRSFFREIAFVTEQLGAANQSIDANLNLIELAQTRASMGLGTQVDVALAHMAYEDAKQEAVELRAEKDILKANFLRHLGLPSSTELELELQQLQIDTLYTLPSEDELIKLALENRFELDVATARIEKAAAQSYIEDSKAWPRLSQIRVGYEMRLGEELEGAVTGGLSLDVPLFNLNGGARAEAEARQSLRKAELDAQVEAIIIEVRKQYRQVQAAAEAVTTLQSGAKHAATKATEAAKASMTAGQVDIRGLAEIESRASAVHRKWLKTLRRYHQEVMQLSEAVGVEQAELRQPH